MIIERKTIQSILKPLNKTNREKTFVQSTAL